MNADMLSNKKLNPVVTEVSIRGIFCFYQAINFAVPKNIRLNSTHYFFCENSK